MRESGSIMKTPLAGGNTRREQQLIAYAKKCVAPAYALLFVLTKIQP